MKAWILTLFFITSALAGDWVKNNALVHLGEMPLPVEERQKIHQMVKNLIVRDLEMSVTSTLEQNGLSAESISHVIEGAPFQNLSKKLVDDPEVGRAIEEMMNRMLTPPLPNPEWGAERLDMAMKRFLLEADLRPKEPSSKSQALLSRLWAKTQRVLFE